MVLLVNIVKEISDDYSRHKLDHRFNQTEVIVLRPDGDEKIKWKDVTVGDILRVMRNEELPADLFLLTTHDRAHRAHVETSNLDGETDWKPKEPYGPTDGMHSLAALQVVPQFADGFLETTNPSQGSSGDSRDAMHSFCANYVYNTPTRQSKEPLGATQLVASLTICYICVTPPGGVPHHVLHLCHASR
jgi:magnesium-transporting ATPase (P-type)